MATTVRQLRDRVEGVLRDDLGRYRLQNGTLTPAIAVRADGEGRPSGTTVEGLEVVIGREPRPEAVGAYRQQQARKVWSVYLVDWAGRTPLATLADRLLLEFPGMIVTTIAVPENVGPSNQLLCEIEAS